MSNNVYFDDLLWAYGPFAFTRCYSVPNRDLFCGISPYLYSRPPWPVVLFDSWNPWCLACHRIGIETAFGSLHNLDFLISSAGVAAPILREMVVRILFGVPHARGIDDAVVKAAFAPHRGLHEQPSSRSHHISRSAPGVKSFFDEPALPAQDDFTEDCC